MSQAFWNENCISCLSHKKFTYDDIDLTTVATSTYPYGSSFQLSDLAEKSENMRNNLQATEKITFLSE
jgi:hypothetical protein